MHAWWIRGNAVLTLCTSVLAAVCIAVSITDVFHKSNPFVHASLVEVQGLQREYDRWVGYRERAWIAVNLTADLQDSFTWNTRQIYLWLTAEYRTEKNQLNQAVFWNWIVESKEDAVISIPRLTHTHPSSVSKHPMSTHYPLDLTDQGENLRGTPFNITVSWNIMPTVGAMSTHRRSFSGFEFPTQYHLPMAGAQSIAVTASLWVSKAAALTQSPSVLLYNETSLIVYDHINFPALTDR